LTRFAEAIAKTRPTPVKFILGHPPHDGKFETLRPRTIAEIRQDPSK